MTLDDRPGSDGRLLDGPEAVSAFRGPSAKTERFARICTEHGRLLVWGDAEPLKPEIARCPAGHRVSSWGVYDLERGRVVAVATRRRVTLLAAWPAERAAAS